MNVAERIKKYLPTIILLILGIYVLDRIFVDAFWNPNNFLLGGSLDALKNYFTPAWFIKYDHGVHFSGMNYPYGEHVLFTDNQPIISWILNWWDDTIFPIADKTVGILNGMIFLSILISMLVLHRIARHFQLPHVYAIPLSILLALLSPQIHRFAGHYALAYTCFVPILWLLLIKLTQKDSRKWLYTALILIYLSASGLVHAYYLLIGALFSFLYMGLYGLKRWRQKKKDARLSFARATLFLLIPVLIIQSFLWITDPIEDRPSNPFGILSYQAHWHTVFMPVQGPLYEAYNRFFHGKNPSMEAFSYVGLTATAVFFLTLARMIAYGWRKRWKRITRFALPGEMRIALWASVWLLIFAMAMPIKWGHPFWVDLVPPLKQFRSLGRFAWAFYTVFTMYAAVYLYLIYRRLKMKSLGNIGAWILFLGLVFWLWDAGIHADIHADIVKSNRGRNAFIHDAPDYKAWIEEAGMKVEDFQAALPVPVFNIGSEKFVPKWTTFGITEQIYRLAYHTGLPMACGSMSRTSMANSSKLVQLFSSDYVEKEIIKDMPDQRPILVLKHENVPISWPEQQLLAKASLLHDGGNYSLHKLELKDLASKGPEVLSRFEAEKDSLFRQDQFYLSDSSWFFFEDFGKGDFADLGKHERVGPKRDPLILFENHIPDTNWMEVSVWAKIEEAQAGFPAFNFKEFDKDDKQIFHLDEGMLFEMNVYKNWLRRDYRFKLKSPGNKAVIYLQGNSPIAGSIMIRDETIDVYLPLENAEAKLMYNNYYLSPPKP
ncbi:MAG: hypothetical protein R8P61_12355 [Bacteroidia bacterium]|nr:hypothetical protein [Bacteroidia bacterium]